MKSEAVAVRERPILFSGKMVRAILDGRKIQTRRVVAPPPELGTDCPYHIGVGEARKARRCPYGQPEERLWVRESFYCDVPDDSADRDEHLYYLADATPNSRVRPCCELIPECQCFDVGKPRWRPSIHMPRWASRLLLEITEVRVQRVQEISRRDAEAEGMREGSPPVSVLCRYRDLWDSLNAKRGYSWESNPWVWAISFNRVAP